MPFVRPYLRSDGTPVRGHSRWAPGARREMTIVAAVGLAVLGFGNVQTATGTDTTQPHPSVTYPVRFDRVPSAPRTAVPRPSVSYPVRFDTPTAKQAKPVPSVSYPIDLSALGGGR
ncbi:hypothetical protein ABZ464_47855 [Streptomyces sp. NPDC005820]|uniref:hypothetical protein n=1 Tax=Streptomyces sp. NPDC005820 TaxID=3157069 RepID=UPI0033E62946